MREWLDRRETDWGSLPKGQMVSVDADELRAFIKMGRDYLAAFDELRRLKGIHPDAIPTAQQMFGT